MPASAVTAAAGSVVDTLVTWGIVSIFVGAMVYGGLGALVGRFAGFEIGAGTALVLFGLTQLGFAAAVAWQVFGPPRAAVPEGSDGKALVGLFCAFGGFGFLGGSVLIANRLEQRRPVVAPSPLGPGVAEATKLLNLLAALLAVAGLLAGSVLGWEVERAIALAFRAVAASCALWAVSFALARQLRWSVALMLLLIGGGFWLGAAALHHLAG